VNHLGPRPRQRDSLADANPPEEQETEPAQIVTDRKVLKSSSRADQSSVLILSRFESNGFLPAIAVIFLYKRNPEMGWGAPAGPRAASFQTFPRTSDSYWLVDS
jgi:hypothetical protein